ncbi:putative Glycosyl transferase [Hyella patelloides LEGE 07179]|uniref:Putative Glycosyl transferase n=1 Tax=Hyella patelloides LEGE 07179 TaxID=945734 RepID=A0A563VPG0_9CYAN|nr:glycosyltransferase family 2 protein [Hyella patelloides]VEP13235.1 putative Glycosyl transferase [Hyella patelloides LEGE 07179]
MKVTVIVPTFKRLDYLQQALNSVSQQTYQHFNCLVVNDYPPDASAIQSILSKMQDSRFVLINQRHSQGGNAARNTGIKQADGDIIAFLDDDDLWLPNKLLQHIQKHQSNPNAGLIYSGFIKRWDRNELPPQVVSAKFPQQDIVTAMNLGRFCPITTSSVTVVNSCFTKCGLFDENLVSFQDWDMWYRIALENDFDCIPEPLIVFRQHFSTRTSQTIDRRLKGLEQVINKWHDSLTDTLEFKRIFLNDLYFNLIRNLILTKQRAATISHWTTLLMLSKTKKEIVETFKLLFMFLLTPNRYIMIRNLIQKRSTDNSQNAIAEIK